MNLTQKKTFITYATGFIGSHVAVRTFVNKYPKTRIIHVNVFTYAGNFEHLKGITEIENDHFIKTNTVDFDTILKILKKHQFNGFIHLTVSLHSPYLASKASPCHFVSTYFDAFGLPIVITDGSNNDGSHQFPKKLIPLRVQNISQGETLPSYGNGKNTRDQLYTVAYAKAIDWVFREGRNGESYNIGDFNEWKKY